MRLAIGIPTRNRAELAVEAVASVVRAEDPRLTLVVSDNSTDAAAVERLRDFCAHQPDWVTYVRPPEPLPMPDHWEFLWHRIRETAEPTHVGYLTDRMRFAPGALVRLMAVVERHPDRALTFLSDAVVDIKTPVQLLRHEWTGQLLELDARRVVDVAIRMPLLFQHMPRMNNSIAPVELLAEVEARFGDVFGAVAADFSVAYRTLAVVDTTLHLDRPSLIQYGLGLSQGFNDTIGRENEAVMDLARNLRGARADLTPAPELRTSVNDLFQEYCVVQQAGNGRFPPLDRHHYLAANAGAVAFIEDPERRARLVAQLERRGWNRRQRARKRLRDVFAQARYYARHPEAYRRERRGAAPRLFPDRAAAVAHAEAHPSPRTTYARHVDPLERAGAIVRTLPSPP